MNLIEVFLEENENEKFVVLKDTNYKIKVDPNVDIEFFCSMNNFTIIKDKRYISSLIIKYFRAYKNGECRVFDTEIAAKRFSHLVEPFKVYKAIYEE